MDENFPYWSALFQRAGEWFSSSLALGTDVVADITDRLSSGMPCLHDHANRHRLPTFNPHGGPITHSSTGSKLDSHVHLPCSRSYSSRVTSYVIREPPSERSSILVSDAMLIPCCSEPHSHSRLGVKWLPTRLKLLTPSFISLGDFPEFQFERYFLPHP